MPIDDMITDAAQAPTAFSLVWTTSERESESLSDDLTGLPHEEVRTREIEGVSDMIVWAVTLASASPLLRKLIDFVDTRFRELHARKLVQSVRVESDGGVHIENATPDQVVQLLKAIAKHAQHD
ncbi:hypothetical protein CDN99_24135 [Roseateles aquatilis]|uniref:Uncharacterized protein n=2 Tax=Roseateles aquatilis TaxID=431061 RepID=A0A246IVY3_9BURK|nr:hypothetical protein CDN99_24135 [Roseateles aquatilis]